MLHFSCRFVFYGLFVFQTGQYNLITEFSS